MQVKRFLKIGRALKRENEKCVVGCCNTVPLNHPVVRVLQNNKPKIKSNGGGQS